MDVFREVRRCPEDTIFKKDHRESECANDTYLSGYGQHVPIRVVTVFFKGVCVHYTPSALSKRQGGKCNRASGSGTKGVPAVCKNNALLFLQLCIWRNVVVRSNGRTYGSFDGSAANLSWRTKSVGLLLGASRTRTG